MTKAIVLISAIIFQAAFNKDAAAQPVKKIDKVLTKRHQSIVAIATFTAKGDVVKLKRTLNDGLAAGLSVNEIKEVIVHLYAYCGFPRSITGLNTFIAVLEGRKAKGITDSTGKEATAIPDTASKYSRGKKVLESLTGQAQSGTLTGYSAFSPEIDVFLKEHLFADIFGRDILSYEDREIATVSALVNLGGVEPMMRSHMGIALHLGFTEPQLKNLLSIIKVNARKEAVAGKKVLKNIIDSRKS